MYPMQDPPGQAGEVIMVEQVYFSLVFQGHIPAPNLKHSPRYFRSSGVLVSRPAIFSPAPAAYGYSIEKWVIHLGDHSPMLYFH